MPWDWGTDRKRDRERVCVLISRNIRGNKGFINDSSQYDDSIQNLQIQHISMLCCFFPICLLFNVVVLCVEVEKATILISSVSIPLSEFRLGSAFFVCIRSTIVSRRIKKQIIKLLSIYFWPCFVFLMIQRTHMCAWCARSCSPIY